MLEINRVRRWLQPDLLVLVLLPVLLQLPAITGWLSADPIYREAALPPDPVSRLLYGDPGWVDGNSGATTQALGHFAAQQWLHGQVPWWNHLTALGMPLAAEMQNSALFLPFVLLLHFQNGVLFLKIALQMLAGISMAALLREYKLGRLPVLAGALLFEFSGTLAWFAHGPIMPIPFLPMLVLGIEIAARRDRDRRPSGRGIIAVAIAGSLYAGFPETAFMDGLVALVVAAVRIAQAKRRAGHLAGRIVGGGLIGLMLAAPAWVPFAVSLPVSFLGQNTDFSGTHLLHPSYALLLFPYILGPILFGTETIGLQADIWWHTGGYCDACLVGAGIASLLCRRTYQRALRVSLGVWLILSFAKSAGVPVISAAFDLVPFVRQTMFYVYAAPGWQFALVLLASLLLDDLRRGVGPRGRARALLVLGMTTGGCTAVILAWPAIHDLIAGHAPHYRGFLIGSLIWGLLSVGAFVMLLSRPAGASLVLVVNALILFGLPILSGTRHGTIDKAPIAFLRNELGLGRGYTLSRLAPNYGAFFGLPMLNYTYVPVPRALASRMQRDMDPTMDVTGLFGDHLRGLGRDVPDPFKDQLNVSESVRRLEALGVRDLLVAHGLDPLQDEIGPLGGVGELRPQPISNGATLSGTIAVPTGAATLQQLGLVLGTYGSHPVGKLSLSLCVATHCDRTEADLANLIDNRTLWLDRRPDIAVDQGDQLAYTITAHLAAGSLAVWTIPQRSGPNSAVPFMMFRYRATGVTLQPVFDNGSSTVLRLPEPKPYVESVGGHCRLVAVDRDRIDASCDNPDVLLRRELFYPGWTATIDRQLTPILAADGETFQEVALPKGRSAVRFRYAPPFIAWAVTAALVGLLLLCLDCTATIRGRRLLLLPKSLAPSPSRDRR